MEKYIRRIEEKSSNEYEEKITLDDVKLFLNSVEKLCDVFQTINDFKSLSTGSKLKTLQK